MGTNRVLAALAAFAVMLGASWLGHSVVMDAFFGSVMSEQTQPAASPALIGAGYLLLAVLMVIVYPTGYGGGSPVAEGARFGALIGVLWFLPSTLVLAGNYGVPLPAIAVEGAWHVVEGILGGIALAMVLGAKIPARSTA